MIFHNCIKCEYSEIISLADKCPVFQKYKCPECKTVQWIKHSRINPETYSEDMVEVNEDIKEIKIKALIK